MAWATTGNLKGPKGDKGDTGAAGATGSPGAPGAPGTPGVNASTNTTQAFTVPASGGTTTVTVVDASWVSVGQPVMVAGAGGSGLAGGLIVTAKTGNQLTLQTP